MARNKKLKPSKRKRRWIGLSFSKNISSKEGLTRSLDRILFECQSWNLYDFNIHESKDGVAIIRIDRTEEKLARNALLINEEKITSLTSSGKIKLVRERLNIHKKD